MRVYGPLLALLGVVLGVVTYALANPPSTQTGEPTSVLLRYYDAGTDFYLPVTDTEGLPTTAGGGGGSSDVNLIQIEGTAVSSTSLPVDDAGGVITVDGGGTMGSPMGTAVLVVGGADDSGNVQPLFVDGEGVVGVSASVDGIGGFAATYHTATISEIIGQANVAITTGCTGACLNCMIRNWGAVPFGVEFENNGDVIPLPPWGGTGEPPGLDTTRKLATLTTVEVHTTGTAPDGTAFGAAAGDLLCWDD